MIYKATQKKVNAYFANPSISQSDIKMYMKGFGNYLNNKIKTKSDKYFDAPADHFIIGNAVDTLLTYEDGEMDKLYYTSMVIKKPSDTEISMIKYIYDKAIDPITFQVGDIHDYKELMIDSVNDHDYYSERSIESRLKVFDSDKVGMYWTDLNLSRGKQILTLQEKELIQRIAHRFKNSALTSKLFSNRDDSCDIFYQVPVYAKVSNVMIKGLIDIIYVDYSNQEVTLYDIKTMNEDVILFPSAYRKFRYDFQSAFYYHILELNSLHNQLQGFNDRTKMLKECIIKDFKFAVISKLYPTQPVSLYSGIDRIQNIIFGTEDNYSNTIANNGTLYETKHNGVMSIDNYILNLYNSIEQNRDVRTINEIIL